MQNILSQYIETTPGVAGGKPRVAGTRITVQNVAIWHERMGLSPDQIADQHGISLAQVHAALAYYHDNRTEIDASIRSDEQFVEQMQHTSQSKMRAKTGG